jgi:Arc/MetJ-type ribon-helix-helix transcriptional regulator
MKTANETEKITINLGPADLGRLDLLVDQGIYSNRSDAIRTGVRNLFEKHHNVIEDVKTRTSAVLGVLILGKSDLEKAVSSGKKLRLNIIGMLVLKNDITPELAEKAIESVSVHGAFRAPKEVRKVFPG